MKRCYASSFSSEEILERIFLFKLHLRRNCVLEELKTIPEITSTGIPATFYAFLDISKTGMSGEEFAMSLLKSKQVALIHGSAYGGPAYRNFIRIAFTMDCSELRKAFARIREFLAERS